MATTVKNKGYFNYFPWLPRFHMEHVTRVNYNSIIVSSICISWEIMTVVSPTHACYMIYSYTQSLYQLLLVAMKLWQPTE